MAKEGAKQEKVCGVKKINKMSRAVCEKELARLNGMNKNKNGVNMGDYSIYKRHVEERLAELS